MKQILAFLFFVMIMLSENVLAQEKTGYEITGHIEGLKEDEKVSMLLSNFSGKGWGDDHLTEDTAHVKNGEFHINGYVPEGPRRYFMKFDKHDGRIHDGILTAAKEIQLYIDNNEKIIISGPDIDEIDHSVITHYVKIEGSPTNYSFLCLEPSRSFYFQNIGRVNNYVKKIKDSVGFDKSFMDGVFRTRDITNQAFYTNFFWGYRDPEIIRADIFLPGLLFETSGHASFWIDVYNNLDEKKKNSFNGKWLKDLIRLCVGQPFPEFSLPQRDGKSLFSKDIIYKNKLTIVNFWTSDADERREALDELKILYKKYHDKGLQIISVSSDKYLDQWNETLKAEQYPWYNVANVGGKMVGEIYRPYDFGKDNPVNVLVDTNGKIVAWDIKGAELQWYLWRQFGE